MAKGYWIVFYHKILDPAKLAEYAKAAGAALAKAGPRYLVRGTPSKAAEHGKLLRVVAIEFESVEKAIAAYESEEYQAAAKLLDGAVERDIRFVEGLS